MNMPQGKPQDNGNKPESQRTVKFEGFHGGREISAEITARQATVRDGMYRTWMQVEMNVPEGEDIQIAWLKKRTYPDMISVSTGKVVIDGVEQTWPIAFEAFLELPEEFGILWERAVYALNPHWRFAGSGATEAEKKAPTPSGEG